MILMNDEKFEEKLSLVLRNLVNFNASSGKSENLHFYVLLLSIAYKVSVKKVQRNDLPLHWRLIQTLNKHCIFIWKIGKEIWWILMRAVEILKTWTLMGYTCRKYKRFEINKYKEFIFHETEQWCKIWIDHVVSNMAWGIGWTFIRALKSLKNCTLTSSFSP